MIQITKVINITNPSGTYGYAWTNNSGSCVSFNKISGNTTGTISTIITFTTEACIATASLNLTITKDNCSTILPVSLTSPCEDLTVSAITQQPNYIYSVIATNPNCNSFTFDWIYDETLFELERGGITSTNKSSLNLKPIANIFPASTQVRVKVTDCNGCTKEVSKTTLFCIPIAQDIQTQLHFSGDGYTSAPIQLRVESSCSTPVDWATAQFNTPQGFTISNIDGLVVITAVSTVDAGAYAITFSVKDVDGVVSTIGTITVEVPTVTSHTISIIDTNTQRDCAKTTGQDQAIYIDEKVVASATIDWSTFEVLTSPTPSSSSIELLADLNGDRYINYEIPGTTGVDVFKWTVADIYGNYALAGTWTVVLTCASNPVLIGKDPCVACNSSVSIDVTDGGTAGSAPFLINSIAIISQPTKGVVIVPNDGTITYIPNSGQIGVDTFTYTIKNADGYTSNTATAEIEIICAGIDITYTVCN